MFYIVSVTSYIQIKLINVHIYHDVTHPHLTPLNDLIAVQHRVTRCQLWSQMDCGKHEIIE